jgi:hypothetical protein
VPQRGRGLDGHESEDRSELDRHNKGVFLQNQREAIERQDYGLDLSHLRRKEPMR